MMIGESNRLNPTVQIPIDPIGNMSPPFSANFNGEECLSPSSFYSLRRYLPSNEFAHSNATEPDLLSDDESEFVTESAFTCDNFRMYEFKVRRCARGRSHDWTECPFAHPGEKARRRDPRKYNYSGISCPEFRKGSCQKGDSCEFAHGVFECWLHPSRYRTQPCKDGITCRRRICFFAHTPDQLRVLSPRGVIDYGSPIRHHFDNYMGKSLSGSFVSSPTSILESPPFSPPSDSPPMSPNGGGVGSASCNSVSELVASIRNLQLNKQMMNSGSWGLKSGFGSPRSSYLRPGFCGVPSTPTQTPSRSGFCSFDLWDSACNQEEPAMERVESGKEIRAKIYAKLSKDNSFDRVELVSSCSSPYDGWVSELLN